MSFINTFLKSQPHANLIPVLFFIFGLITFFTLNFMVPFWIVCLLLIGAGCFLYFIKNRFLTSCVFYFILAFFVCGLHCAFNKTVFLPDTIKNAFVTGQIEKIDQKLTYAHIILSNVAIDDADKKNTPQKIQLTIKKDKDKYQKGDYIWAKVLNLAPPAVPVLKGGYYQAREYYFNNLGATGYILKSGFQSKNKKIEQQSHLLTDIRQNLKNKIDVYFNDENKGVVNSLILGDLGYLTTSTKLLYRTLGLSHILTISGFHISLIFLFFFFVFRYIFILCRVFTKNLNNKKIAGILALIFVLFYVLLSGAHPPAMRALIMFVVVVVALFLDRPALSPYSIFLAGFLLLCYKPVLVLNVGFQLSFMAVLSLVVLVTGMQSFLHKGLIKSPLILLLSGILLLNFIVILTTLPFVLYHFHQIALYGVLGNFCFAFLFSILVIPLLVVGLILLPFGGCDFIFMAVDKILTSIYTIGLYITDLPHQMIYISGFDAWGLLLFFIGIMILILLQGKARFVGLIFIALFPLSFITYEKPDMMIAQNAKVFAIRDKSGQYHLSESHRFRFITNQWLTMNGQNPDTYFENKRFNPDIITINQKQIALSPKHCQTADITLALKKGNYDKCQNVHTYDELSNSSPIHIYIKDDKITIKSLKNIDKNMPWALK